MKIESLRVTGDGLESLRGILTYAVGQMHHRDHETPKMTHYAMKPMNDQADRPLCQSLVIYAWEGDGRIPLAVPHDAQQVAELGVTWVRSLAETRDCYPKFQSYADSLNKGWRVKSGWKGEIEISPWWIEISK